MAIGICAMMIMPVFFDRNKKVVRSVIHWLDERLNQQFLELKRKGIDRIITIYSGSALTGESTVNTIFWIKENEPEIYKKIHKFVMIKDFIRFKLTGRLLSDFGDASGSLMLDTKKWKWSNEVLNELGLNVSMFPDLFRPTEISGYVTKDASNATGLKEGIPVAVSSGDGISTIFGLGIHNDGQIGITVGSAGVIGASTTKFPSDGKNRGYVFCHPQGDRWYSMMATAASGEVFRWYKERIIKNDRISFKELDHEAEKAPPGTDSIIFLPYILGSRNPYSNPKANGMFLGLRYKHDRSYVTRAILEGISFELLDILETQKEILRKNSIEITEAKLSGGIVKSKFWPKLLSDILQKDLIITSVEELGTFGSSIIASVAVGIHSNIEIAIKKMIKTQEIIKHDESLKQTYFTKYSIFKEIYHTLETKFGILNPQFN
jgi:xylulokinase